MRPIQLWLPTIQGGIQRQELRQDMQRAYRAWNRDHVVWIMKGWDGPERWKEEGLIFLGVSGEITERMLVYHIGGNGRIVGPSAVNFPKKSMDQLLIEWLGESKNRFLDVPKVQPLSFDVPHAHPEGGVFYAKRDFEVETRGTIPISKIGTNKGEVFLQWPPNSNDPVSISPELETARYASTEKSRHTHIGWPKPFRKLMPKVSSLDDFNARALMKGIVEESCENPVKALTEAKKRAQEWVSTGLSDVYQTWLLPIFVEEGETGALLAMSGKYGLEAMSLEEAYQREDWQEVLRRPVEVTRVWGIPGLMWALLIDRLEQEVPFKHCKGCGGIISGKGDKEYCGKIDNNDCFKARRRKDRRRSRHKQ